MRGTDRMGPDAAPPVILVVDDMKENLYIIRELIAGDLPDVRVHTTTDPMEAIGMAVEYLPDGILLDVQMPVMDGLEVCRRLKNSKSTEHIPIVLFTAHSAAPRLKADGLEAGADDFLAKPIDNIELVAKIKVMLRIKRTEDRLREINKNLENIVETKTAALVESEEKHRTLFETMVEGVVYQDADGGIVSANPAAERLLGLSPDQMMGRTSVDPRWKSIHKDGSDFPGETHPSMVALKTGKPVNDAVMGVFNPGDETYRWLNINAVPLIRDGEEKPYRVYTTFADITQRKQAEEELRKSEERYRLIFDNSHDLITITDDNAKTLWANRAWLEVFGDPGAQPDPFERIHPDDLERTRKAWAALISGESDLMNFEYRYLANDRGYMTFETTARKFVFGGEPVVCIFAHDITGRKQAEEELQQYEHIVSSSTDMMALLDKKFVYLAANTAYMDAFKFTPGELIGHTVADVLGEEVFENIVKPNAQRCLAGERVNYRDWFDFPAYGPLYMDINYYPYSDRDKGVKGFIVNARDGTDRKRAEDALKKVKEELEIRVEERTKELKESEEKFKTLSEKSMVGIFILQHNAFKYINPAFAQIFDYPIHRLTGKTFADIVYPGDRAKMKEKSDKLKNGDIDYSHAQFRGVQKNGETRYLEVYEAAIRLENKPAVIGTVIDVTQRTHFESALREKTGQLAELNRDLENRIKSGLEERSRQERLMMQQSKLAAMGEMVGAIAHQWRQPLSTVGVIIQNLKMAHKLKKLDAHMLENSAKDAMGQIKFMSNTIDDFRNFFKPSKEKENFSVLEAVEHTISLVRAQLENNIISVHLQVGEGTPLRVSGYPNEFKQVLVNIINNARSAIEEKRKKGNLKTDTGDIFIDITRAGKNITITIANNGDKIPKKVMARIFEPYFTTRKDGKGTGIGLYMSKTIVEDQMDGHIFAENTKDGARFTLQLKAA